MSYLNYLWVRTIKSISKRCCAFVLFLVIGQIQFGLELEPWNSDFHRSTSIDYNVSYRNKSTILKIPIKHKYGTWANRSTWFQVEFHQITIGWIFTFFCYSDRVFLFFIAICLNIEIWLQYLRCTIPVAFNRFRCLHKVSIELSAKK